MDKLVLVAGFASVDESQHSGGVITATRLLMSSSFSKEFDVIQIDTTASISETFSLKIRKSLSRFSKLFCSLRDRKVKYVFCWAAGGFSLYEKLLMLSVARFFGKKTYLIYVDSIWMEKIRKRAFWRWLHGFLYRIPNRLICRSKRWVELYEDLSISSSRTCIVPNWLHVPTLTNAAFDFKNSKLSFVFVGWLIRDKGVFELLDAAAKVFEMGVEIDLTYVGGGPELESLMDLAKAKNIQEVVHFTDWVAPGDVAAYLDAADVFVLPSYGEGFPYSMLEAMSKGLPVIISDVGGIRGMFKDGEQVMLVEPKDVEGLASKLLYSIDNPVELQRIAKNGYEYVYDTHSTENSVGKLIKCIRSLP